MKNLRACCLVDCNVLYYRKGFCKPHYRQNYRQSNKYKEGQKAYRQSAKGQESIRKYQQSNKSKDCKKSYRQSAKGLFKGFLSDAKRRKLPVDITFEQYSYLRATNCFYCYGALPTQGSALDRLDNDYGYYIHNVVPCCTACNRIRGNNLSVIETAIAIQAVLLYRRLHKPD